MHLLIGCTTIIAGSLSHVVVFGVDSLISGLYFYRYTLIGVFFGYTIMGALSRSLLEKWFPQNKDRFIF